VLSPLKGLRQFLEGEPPCEPKFLQARIRPGRTSQKHESPLRTASRRSEREGNWRDRIVPGGAVHEIDQARSVASRNRRR
jgi:hypothetical protein